MVVAVWNSLPLTHPWKRRGLCFTLREWHAGSTMATHSFDLFFWVTAFMLPRVLMILLNKLLT